MRRQRNWKIRLDSVTPGGQVEASKISYRIKNRRILALCGVFLGVVAAGYGWLRWHVRNSEADTLQQAERFLRQRDGARAREALKWLLWFEPTHHRALLFQAASLNADRAHSQAIEVLERIPEESDTFAESGIVLAATLVLDDQLERAELVLKRYSSRFPRSYDACERLVRVYLKLLRQRDAITLLMDFWNHEPADAWALPHLLELESKSMTAQDRVAPLEAADRKHPRQANVVLALAQAYSLTGKTEPARTQFEIALQLRPQDAVTRILAADFYLSQGDVDSARRLLNMSSADALNDDRYWFARCRLAEQLGAIPDAYAHLEKAVALRPNDETYLLKQAALLRRQGRTDEARTIAHGASLLAENRKRLMLVSDKLDRTHPSPAHCLEIADLLDRLGCADQGAAWRRVSQALEPADSPNDAPSPVRPPSHSIPSGAP